MSEATIPIKELMEKTEQWLLGQGYKKSTLGFYRATWNRFLSYSASPAYSRETAEQFLLQYFGVDVHAIDQTLDGRMRHARRHMNALDEIFRTGTVCRRKVYGVASIDDDCFDKFFSDYLSYCKMQNFSRSWMDNTIAALRLFLLAVHSSNTQNIKSINAETINCFSTAMSNASEICMNVRRARCRQVGAYLHWLYATNIRIWIIPFNSQTSNALHPRFHRYGVLKKSTRFLQSSILPIQLEGGITRFFCFLQEQG